MLFDETWGEIPEDFSDDEILIRNTYSKFHLNKAGTAIRANLFKPPTDASGQSRTKSRVYLLYYKMKKYRVTLTCTEVIELKALIASGKYKNTKQKRAQILLAANESEGGKKMKDTEISKAFDVQIRTVERTRQRFVEDGYLIAIQGKPREITKEKLFDSRVESHLVALRCSDSPEGYNKWSLRLLADKMIELEYVDSISHESVRQILKKTKLSLGE